ncbi:MAG: hypothetical protein B7Y39_03060 [Bdellovibrio sp. 28-41-41]|nr:MAG: hypothetical protein B7Y39_03060 [Bdellovibrio sp. 28-41-41]
MSKIKVNVIGDSHTALTFGQTIIERISNDVDLHLIAFSGLRLQHLSQWMDQKAELKILNCEFKYRSPVGFSKNPEDIGFDFDINDADVLVVALGTNDIVKCVGAKASFKTYLESSIKMELEKIKVEKVIFVEPPLLNIDKDAKIRTPLLALIKSFDFKVIPCGQFKADQSDGIHMRKEMAQYFGDSVAKALLKLILPHH